MALPEKLKSLREEKGITQDEMAKLLCVKRQTYGAYERGVSFPDLKSAKIIADFFQVTVDFLIADNKNSFDLKQNFSIEQNQIIEACVGMTSDETDRILDYIGLVRKQRVSHTKNNHRATD